MIGSALNFLRRQLDAYLRAELASGVDDPIADKVVFLEGDKLDPLGFKEESVSELLINVEEERLLRAADPYAHVQDDGRPRRGQPDLRLVLHILFVARFKQYDSAWDHLTKVLEYLQSNRIIERGHPELPAQIERLTFELMSQSFSELSNVWNILRGSYLPSVLYRVGLVVLRDVKSVAQDQITEPVTVDVRSLS
jgi:hypothetical protein